MTESLLPTERLTIVDPLKANDEILAFAEKLEAEGKRPWFEVWYPTPVYADDSDEWQAAQQDTFDAVEVIDGQIKTLPPYTVILGA